MTDDEHGRVLRRVRADRVRFVLHIDDLRIRFDGELVIEHDRPGDVHSLLVARGKSFGDESNAILARPEVRKRISAFVACRLALFARRAEDLHESAGRESAISIQSDRRHYPGM